MPYESDAALSQEQHIWIAEQAVYELYGLAEWAMVIWPPGYLIFSDHVARVIDSLMKEQRRKAIVPVTTYLIHVPLFDGSGYTKSSYTPPKPGVHIIEKAVDFLAWMGDSQALPALQRIASTHRNIPTLIQDEHIQDEHYEDTPNDRERAHAEWAIRMIQAVQSKGYSLCESCNGQGRYACRNCKGSGKVKKRFLLRKRKVMCPECYGAMTIECSICGGFGKLLPILTIDQSPT